MKAIFTYLCVFLIFSLSACGPVAGSGGSDDSGDGGDNGGGGSSIYPTQMTGKTITIEDVDGPMQIAMQTLNNVTITQGDKTFTGIYTYDLPTDSNTATANYSVTDPDSSTVLLISARFIYESTQNGVFAYIKRVDGTAFPEHYTPFTL